MYDPGALYLDPILTNFSTGYEDQTLYGLQILPETPVNTQSGKYRVYDRSNWIIFKSIRAPGTVANEVVGGKWSQDTFSTTEHSLQSPVLDEEDQQLRSQGGLANAFNGGDLQLDPHRDATELVTRSLLLEHEQKVAAKVRDPAIYASTNKVDITTATDRWDIQGGTATGDPVAVIRTGMRAVRAITGRWPNTLAIPTMGATYLETHPKIVDRFKNFALSISDAFQTLTGFQGKILLVDSVYNAANNIDATEAITSFWGKDVWLGIVDPQPGQLTRTFGKTFAQVYPSGDTKPTDRWREEPRKADLVRTSWKYDIKIVSPDAGYLIQNAFTSTAF